NEQRFVDWITDRMNSWNQDASKTLYASLGMKESLTQSLGVTNRWYGKLSPQAQKKVKALYARTDQIIHRKEFEWQKDLGGGFGDFAIIGRIAENLMTSAMVIKFAGVDKEPFRFPPDLFKKDRDPKEVLKTIDSSYILYKPIPAEWQKPVWDFLNNHYDELYKEKSYWRALGSFVENNTDYVPAFIEEMDKWKSKLPEKDWSYAADQDGATTFEQDTILNRLAEEFKVPEEYKLAVYHYILTRPDNEKNYHKIQDVKTLEERLMSDYLVESAKDRFGCLPTFCDLGRNLFIKKAGEWGSEKTIDFMKRVFPKEMHDKLSLSFRFVKLLIGLDREEIDKFLAELRDPKRRDVEAINNDPLWYGMWNGLLDFPSAVGVVDGYITAGRRYGAHLNNLPRFLLGKGKKDLVEEFYFKNHPYAKLYSMPKDIQPTGKGLSFVSIDSFADPKKIAHVDKQQVHLLNGGATQWKEVDEQSTATHGVATSTLAVGARYGLAPEAKLYIAPVDFESENLPAI
ncbi:MAG: hypothetical protein KAJ19_17410, partial [Gammaproteobacteria bacterium]|nr:hypothetical protein [Gammaproteobacteria bacterium]